jgi:hypothetical protein
MSGELSGVELLMARMQIHDVINRYCQGFDQGDPAKVRTCFTEDVEFAYHARPPGRGIEVLMASFEPFFSRLASGKTKISDHFTGNVNFESVTATEAVTETYAVGFIVLARENADQLAVVGMRYLDRFSHTPSGWRIAKRVHALDWSSDQGAKIATKFAERVSRIA